MRKGVSILILFAFLGGIFLMPTPSFATGEVVEFKKEVMPINLPIEPALPEVRPISITAADILYELGLFKGTDLGYSLDKAATRAEGLTMILRLIGEEGKEADKEKYEIFKDVAENHWALKNINYGAMKGYIAGTSERTFHPERKITEAEFLKILLSAIGHHDITLENVYEKAKEFGILPKDWVPSEKGEFLRDKMVTICHQALKGKTAKGEPLWNALVEKGILVKEQLENLIGLSSETNAVVEGFPWELKEFMPKDANYMFSPLSIKMALAMAAVGADGETKDEILATLGIEDLDEFMEFARKLIKTYSENDEVALNIANSIWLNQDYYPGAQFTEAFQQVIRDYFNGESNEVGKNNAVEKINAWVDEKTQGRITDLVSDSDFLAYLVNAIYFKGEWALQFDEAATKPAEFTDRDGKVTEIDFMNKVDFYDYYADENLQMIRLPYKDGKTSMYVALSEMKNLDLVSYIKKLEKTRVALSLPKFKTELSIELNDILKAMGISEAFIPDKANFKPMIAGIKAGDNVFISDVIHKTFIEVDENGTEAAAVTGIGFRVTSMPLLPDPVVFKADKPFTYFIYDDVNEEILFMGEQAFTE